MAAFNKEIVIKTELRPCYYQGDNKALFHKWIEESYIVPPSPMVGGHKGGLIKETFALIELEVGRLIKAKVSDIRFADSEHKFEGFAF